MATFKKCLTIVHFLILVDVTHFALLTSTHPTGILPNGYNPPDDFCWDQSCSDSPIRDDPDLEDYNVDNVVRQFIDIAKSQVSTTDTQTHTTS